MARPEPLRVLAGTRRLQLTLLMLAAVAASISWTPSTNEGTANADSGVLTLRAQPVIGVPVSGVTTLIGSSPGEAPGETWGYSGTETRFQVVRYTQAGGWHLQPQPLANTGEPLGSFRPASGPQAGRTTPAGGVAILGRDQEGVDQLLVRDPDPGGGLHEAPTLTPEPEAGAPPEPNALLKTGETLFAPESETILMTAVELEGGKTGAFVVPHESASTPPSDVLFYDGAQGWQREPICSETAGGGCTAPPAGFKVLGIDASSTHNAWLLVQSGVPGDGVVLFAREGEGEQARWTRRPLGGALGALFGRAKSSFPGAGNPPVTIQALVKVPGNGQPLTVADGGLWVDGQIAVSTQPNPASFTLYYNVPESTVSASWCSFPLEASLPGICSNRLEGGLPTSGAYRSFAWSQEGQYGQRVITGLGNGVTMSLHGEAFARVPGDGGNSGTSAGAAFSSPQEGWLADDLGGPLTHLTTSPELNLLQPWPVTFRHPLTAIATQPGTTPGELDSQAIAVGQEGQVAHYFPGRGWVPEALLNSLGKAEPADLRGVAWPEPGRAYAVGTNGAMWLWQQATGLWEPDPTRPPNLFLANLTGISFDPTDPARGYAIGQQGVMLAYSKTWEKEPLPPGLSGPEGANFTSIAFAGGEALATYRVPNFKNAREYVGGVLANDGRGWRTDVEADAALPAGAIPTRVAGLPDGGAAIADESGEVIERQGPGSPWQAAPAGPVGGSPVALAAFREGAALRTVISVGEDESSLDLTGDETLRQNPPEGQAPITTAPYALPASGELLRETPHGWRDEQHETFPAPNHSPFEKKPSEEHGVDWPNIPDAVLALALPPDGGEGWAVGGQTGEVNAGQDNSGLLAEAIQTAGVMRYPASGGTPPGFSRSPEPTGTGNATFAIGGNAQCAAACADLSEDQLGPDKWLENAIEGAALTPHVRAFLYTGPHLAAGLGKAGGIEATAFRREEERYSSVLSGSAGSLPVYTSATESDIDNGGNLEVFKEELKAKGHLPTPEQEQLAPPLPPANSGAYAFESKSGPNGEPVEPVRVIVLDYSHPTLGAEQQCWLARQLASAKSANGKGDAAIVLGNRGMSGSANVAADANQVIPILVKGTVPAGCTLETGLSPSGASAYFYDSPEQNRTYWINTPGGTPVPTFGSGTLGYIANVPPNDFEFLGASGFLLAEVETAKRDPETNRAPVNVKLTPDISDLALEATNGVLLRRSQAALFKALARRPRAGMLCEEESVSCLFAPNPYVPIPSVCTGTNCATGLLPTYTFTSSNPDIGGFVETDPASPEGTTVLQNAKGEPIPDEPRDAKGEPTANGQFEVNSAKQPINERREVVPSAQSGLFCAYNEGETTITVHAGGLSYSQTVKILTGSVEQPCGTVRLRHPPAPAREASLPVPLPAPAPTPTPTPNSTLPPPPPPPALVPVPAPPARLHPSPPVPVPVPAAQLFPLIPLVPAPAPAAARPTPPSGTAQVPSQSQVSQQVSVTEREEEKQGAIQHVHNMAAYSHPGPGEDPVPAWTLGLVLVALAAGLGARRGRRDLAYVEQLPGAR